MKCFIVQWNMIRSQCSVICFKDVYEIKAKDIKCAFIYLKNTHTLFKKQYNICKCVYGKEVKFLLINEILNLMVV